MESNQKSGGIKLTEVNAHLTCHLCKGYLIDATTIVECLHSFCRSCIIKHLQFKSYCAVCEMMINKAKPNIKPDKTLQDIVYKLVPGLHRAEMRRRRAFYQKHGDAGGNVSPEQRGEDYERTIYNTNDSISLSIEYCSDSAEVESLSSRSSSDSGNNRTAADQHQETSNNCPTPQKRYLQCPAGLAVRHLKKFIVTKYDIDIKLFYVDILYKRVPLPDHYTLMDVAYIYSWKRNEPMRFFYRVIDINFATDRFDFFEPQSIVKSHALEKTNDSSDDTLKIKSEKKVETTISASVEYKQQKKIKSSDDSDNIKINEQPCKISEQLNETREQIKTSEELTKTSDHSNESHAKTRNEQTKNATETKIELKTVKLQCVPVGDKNKDKSNVGNKINKTVKFENNVFGVKTISDEKNNNTKKNKIESCKVKSHFSETSETSSKNDLNVNVNKKSETKVLIHSDNETFSSKSDLTNTCSENVSEETDSEIDTEKSLFLNTFELTSTKSISPKKIEEEQTKNEPGYSSSVNKNLDKIINTVKKSPTKHNANNNCSKTDSSVIAASMVPLLQNSVKSTLAIPNTSTPKSAKRKAKETRQTPPAKKRTPNKSTPSPSPPAKRGRKPGTPNAATIAKQNNLTFNTAVNQMVKNVNQQSNNLSKIVNSNPVQTASPQSNLKRKSVSFNLNNANDGPSPAKKLAQITPKNRTSPGTQKSNQNTEQNNSQKTFASSEPVNKINNPQNFTHLQQNATMKKSGNLQNKLITPARSVAETRGQSSQNSSPLKSLFDSCKLNIPSSLSITLTDGTKEPSFLTNCPNSMTVTQVKTDAPSTINSRRESPPVNMYIEIFKIPENSNSPRTDSPVFKNGPTNSTLPKNTGEQSALIGPQNVQNNNISVIPSPASTPIQSTIKRFAQNVQNQIPATSQNTTQGQNIATKIAPSNLIKSPLQSPSHVDKINEHHSVSNATSTKIDSRKTQQIKSENTDEKCNSKAFPHGNVNKNKEKHSVTNSRTLTKNSESKNNKRNSPNIRAKTLNSQNRQTVPTFEQISPKLILKTEQNLSKTVAKGEEGTLNTTNNIEHNPAVMVPRNDQNESIPVPKIEQISQNAVPKNDTCVSKTVTKSEQALLKAAPSVKPVVNNVTSINPVVPPVVPNKPPVLKSTDSKPSFQKMFEESIKQTEAMRSQEILKAASKTKNPIKVSPKVEGPSTSGIAPKINVQVTKTIPALQNITSLPIPKPANLNASKASEKTDYVENSQQNSTNSSVPLATVTKSLTRSDTSNASEDSSNETDTKISPNVEKKSIAPKSLDPENTQPLSVKIDRKKNEQNRALDLSTNTISPGSDTSSKTKNLLTIAQNLSQKSKLTTHTSDRLSPLAHVNQFSLLQPATNQNRASNVTKPLTRPASLSSESSQSPTSDASSPEHFFGNMNASKLSPTLRVQSPILVQRCSPSVTPQPKCSPNTLKKNSPNPRTVPLLVQSPKSGPTQLSPGQKHSPTYQSNLITSSDTKNSESSSSSSDAMSQLRVNVSQPINASTNVNNSVAAAVGVMNNLSPNTIQQQFNLTNLAQFQLLLRHQMEMQRLGIQNPWLANPSAMAHFDIEGFVKSLQQAQNSKK